MNPMTTIWEDMVWAQSGSVCAVVVVAGTAEIRYKSRSYHA